MTKFILPDDQKIYLAEVLNSSRSEIYIFDAETFKFIYVNHGAIVNLQYSANELKELTPWDIKPVSHNEFIRMIHSLTDGKVKKLDFETQHIRKDKTKYDVEVHLEMGYFGERKCYFANILDITEKKRLINDLLKSSRLASTGEMALSVGHEINNPLMIIELCLNKIKKTLNFKSAKKESDFKINLDRITDGLERIKKVTSSLRSFSKIESSDKKPHNVNQMIRDAVEFISEMLINSNIKVNFELDERTPFVNCTTGGFQQVILNLILNARDALAENLNKKEIYIKTEILKEDVLISITDNGPGIDKSIRNHIFNSFVTTKESQGGSGLGLSISNHLVKEFNGFIEVDQSYTKGAKLLVRFPISKPETIDLSKIDTEEKMISDIMIAIIDDEELLREVIKDVLEDSCFNVEEFASIDEFLNISHEINFDLVISDINMPGKSGIDLLKYFQSEQPDYLKKVMLITGGSLECLDSIGKSIIEVNKIDVLFKPFDMEQLVSMVNVFLAK